MGTPQKVTKMIKPSILLEVRNAQFDKFAFIDKATGKNISGQRIKCAAEASDDKGAMLQVVLVVPLPPEAKETDPIPLKRGQKVLAHLESWEVEKGVGKARVAGLAALTAAK